MKQKTALVLSGGAARGAFQLGVWQALLEMDIPIDIITGTSIGAVNGAMIVMGSYETLFYLWENLGLKQILGINTADDDPYTKIIMSTYAGLAKNFLSAGGSDIHSLLDVAKPFLDEEKIRQSPIDFGLVTVCLTDRKPLAVFTEDIPQGDLLNYILASCSVAPAFKPLKIGDKHYVDGCYHDNLPISLALEKGAEKIIAVDLNAYGKVNKKLLQTTPNLTLIRSHWDLGNSFFFNPQQVRRNARLGYLHTLRDLGRQDGQTYSFPAGTAVDLAVSFLVQEGKLPFLTDIKPQSFFLNNRQASKALFYYLRRRLLNKTAKEHMILAWAENAGEIFGLDPLKEYTLEEFNKEILEKAKETVALTLPDSLADLLHQGFPKHFGRPALAKRLAEQIENDPEILENSRWIALAPVFPGELLAALYLQWLKFA